jgi:hypothetical protein
LTFHPKVVSRKRLRLRLWKVNSARLY